MEKLKDIDFAYASARVRAVENSLFDKAKLDRMIDAQSAMDAARVLIDADYGVSSAELNENVYNYERLLSEELEKAYALISEISPQKEILDVLRIRNDYNIIKIILKAEFLGTSDFQLSDTGSICVEKLKTMVRERSFSDLDNDMRDAVEESIDVYGRTNDPQAIDIILDVSCYKLMKKSAEHIQNDFLTVLVEAMIDLINIKIFIRLKALNKQTDFFNKTFLYGGKLDKSLFINNLDTQLEVFQEALKYTPYGDAAEKGIENYRNTGSMTILEKVFDNYIIEYIKKSKHISMGLEPLIGYLVAKENEIKNIRIIMIGKINNISPETIRERLRENYV